MLQEMRGKYFGKQGKSLASSRGKDLFLGLEGKKFKWIQIKFENGRAERGRNPALHSCDQSKSNILHSKKYIVVMPFPPPHSSRDYSPVLPMFSQKK